MAKQNHWEKSGNRPEGRWFLLIGAGRREKGGTTLLYDSKDLRHWCYLRPLLMGVVGTDHKPNRRGFAKGTLPGIAPGPRSRSRDFDYGGIGVRSATERPRQGHCGQQTRFRLAECLPAPAAAAPI